MSALPPIRPSVTPTAPANAAAVRDARAQFFRALGEVAGAAPTRAAAAPAITKETMTASVQPPTAPDPARPSRPGSLLDIRV